MFLTTRKPSINVGPDTISIYMNIFYYKCKFDCHVKNLNKRVSDGLFNKCTTSGFKVLSRNNILALLHSEHYNEKYKQNYFHSIKIIAANNCIIRYFSELNVSVE